jgi:hypothetical protein
VRGMPAISPMSVFPLAVAETTRRFSPSNSPAWRARTCTGSKWVAWVFRDFLNSLEILRSFILILGRSKPPLVVILSYKVSSSFFRGSKRGL